jgi:subfamily B ATP-binding cassette protein MsbA
MSLYRRILDLVKPYWGRLGVAMICVMGVSLLTGTQAFLVKPIFNGVLLKSEQIPPSVRNVIIQLHLDSLLLKEGMEMLLLLPVAIILLFLFKGIFYYGQAYFMNYVGLKIVADVREKLYNHLQTLSLSFFTKTPTGVIISRITNDATLIQASVSNAIAGLLMDIFTIIVLVGVILYRDWELGIIGLILFPLAFIPIKEFGKRIRKFSLKSFQRIGSLTTFLHETITGNRIVKAFNMEEYEKLRFAAENYRFFKVVFKRMKIRALSHPLMELLGGVAVAIIIWVGGYRVARGDLTPGDFFSFLAALWLLYAPIRNLNRLNLEIQEGVAAAARVFEFLDAPVEIKDEDDAICLPPISKGIEFEQVNFKYDGETVLKNISFDVKVGEVIALVGMSGAGKTSLVNLLPRFYDVEDGHISIDGHDIRNITLYSLREQIGLVTQQTILFNDTVRNNIAYGRQQCSDQEIIDAAKAANAHDFIIRLPQGYETIVGEQGVKLSGGERQRLSIARALLKNAPILILDEATSSLDSDSEMEVQKALEELMKGRTVFVIAHRLSTIRNAHRIIVLSEGRIVEAGTHDALMALNGEYRRLHDLQFKDDATNALKATKTKTIY